ncbi:MAG: hypothetical protein ACOY4H_02080 [Thermodesulfobacteriota bacterium]
MKEQKQEKPACPTENIRGDVKPEKLEAPHPRPKPTPKLPKKK